MLLMRSALAAFWEHPYERKLDPLGHAGARRLHAAALRRDRICGRRWRSWRLLASRSTPTGSRRILAFRFPHIGTIDVQGMELELRNALEPWHVLGEEQSGCRHRPLRRQLGRAGAGAGVRLGGGALHPGLQRRRRAAECARTGEGEYVAGVRFKAWNPPSSLHPTIGPHVPLVFDIYDRWSGRSLGGMTYQRVPSRRPVATTRSRSTPMRPRLGGARGSSRSDIRPARWRSRSCTGPASTRGRWICAEHSERPSAGDNSARPAWQVTACHRRLCLRQHGLRCFRDRRIFTAYPRRRGNGMALNVKRDRQLPYRRRSGHAVRPAAPDAGSDAGDGDARIPLGWRLRDRADVRPVYPVGDPAGAVSVADVARRRHDRRHVGDEARWRRRLAVVLSECRARCVCIGCGGTRPRRVVALSRSLSGRATFPVEARILGIVSFWTAWVVSDANGHADGLFPLEHFDQFSKQVVPRWACNDALTQAAYDALLRKVGPSVVMTHSQSGAFGFNAALNAPDVVRAVVTVEPSGAPDPDVTDVARVRAVPHLMVLGDHIEDDPFWQAIVAPGPPLSRRHSGGWRDADISTCRLWVYGATRTSR